MDLRWYHYHTLPLESARDLAPKPDNERFLRAGDTSRRHGSTNPGTLASGMRLSHVVLGDKRNLKEEKKKEEGRQTDRPWVAMIKSQSILDSCIVMLPSYTSLHKKPEELFGGSKCAQVPAGTTVNRLNPAPHFYGSYDKSRTKSIACIA